MTTNTRINGKVLWHVHGGKARVINFKDIPTQEEIVEKYGTAISEEYFSGNRGPVCFIVSNGPFSVPYITLAAISRETAEKIGSKSIPVYTSKYGFKRYVAIWEDLPIEGMKIVNDLVSKANDHLNGFIDIVQHSDDLGR
jgi:hypothetical protein